MDVGRKHAEAGATAAPLANGDVLVVRAVFFSPGTGAWTATVSFPNVTMGRTTATLLSTRGLITGLRSTYNGTLPYRLRFLQFRQMRTRTQAT
jgi:hypothetical protein